MVTIQKVGVSLMSDIDIRQRRVSAGRDFNQNFDNSHNINNYLMQPQHLEKTLIYALLQRFLANNQTDREMDISMLPTELNQKLNYNCAYRYVQIFQDKYQDTAYIQEVITNDFPDGQLIVGNLRDMFHSVLPHEAFQGDGTVKVENGDEVLDKLFQNVKERIINDPQKEKDEIPIEKIERFVYAFLGYGVQECQVLLNPNQG